jgi:preprotein translocase subunit SecG
MFVGVSANWASSRPENGIAADAGEQKMLDLLMAMFTGLFFVIALAYVKACEHLK